MITINQLKIEMKFHNKRLRLSEMLDQPETLQKKAAKVLGIGMNDIKDVTILKHSIDARKKPQLFQVYTLGVELKDSKQEEKLVRHCRNNHVALFRQLPYTFPASGSEKDRKSVV